MNKKGFFLGLAGISWVMVLIVAVLIFLIFGGILVFAGLNKFQLAGIAIAVLGFIFAIKPAMSGTDSLDNKKIALILIIFLFAGGLFLAPYLGLIQNTQLSSTFTPVYCRQPVFTCCGEKVSTISIGSLTDQQSYKCPSNANFCLLKSYSGQCGLTGNLNNMILGSSSCAVGYHPTVKLIGNVFYCNDDKTITTNQQFTPNDYLHTYCSLKSGTVETHTNRLAFCGPSACDAATTGIEVNGADGCTFNPSATYDNNGKLIKFNVSGISYPVNKGSCVLNWQDGMRYICGNLEEKCQSDNDCIGHTYGNSECTSRTLQTYGCTELNLPTGVIKEASGTLSAGDARPNQPQINGILSKCDVKNTRQVQCCGDTDCGSNAFCDNNPSSPTAWTCKPKDTVQCTSDTQCGVSQQCDINTKEIKTPKCLNSKCTFQVLNKVECCSSVDCPTNYYCGDDKSCKQSTIPKVDCVGECCVGDSRYFDKPCATGLFCVNGLCSSKGCTKDEECLKGKVCKDGNCIDAAEVKCTWYQQSYTAKSLNYGFLGWRHLTRNPIETTTTGCKTASWVTLIIVGIFFILITVVIVLLLKSPKKGRKKKKL